MSISSLKNEMCLHNECSLNRHGYFSFSHLDKKKTMEIPFKTASYERNLKGKIIQIILN